MNHRQSTMRRHAGAGNNGASALVITESEAERIFVKAALDGLLYGLRFTDSGRDALAMLSAESIAVVIADGDASAPSWRKLREQTSSFEAGPAPKFIVVSRRTDEEDEKQRPSLLAPEAECPPVKRREYKPGQRIETICALPGT